MISQRFSMLFCAGGIIAAACVFLSGCQEQEAAHVESVAVETAVQQPVVEEPKRQIVPQPQFDKGDYSSDLERLEKIAGRINSVSRSTNSIMLGAGQVVAGSGVISIDYGLFDRLSDDGVAVLIAEAVVGEATQWDAKDDMELQRTILAIDETVGRHVAGAGFKSSGFREWLEAEVAYSADIWRGRVAGRARIDAFMRGYLSAAGVRPD